MGVYHLSVWISNIFSPAGVNGAGAGKSDWN